MDLKGSSSWSEHLLSTTRGCFEPPTPPPHPKKEKKKVPSYVRRIRWRQIKNAAQNRTRINIFDVLIGHAAYVDADKGVCRKQPSHNVIRLGLVKYQRCFSV